MGGNHHLDCGWERFQKWRRFQQRFFLILSGKNTFDPLGGEREREGERREDVLQVGPVSQLKLPFSLST